MAKGALNEIKFKIVKKIGAISDTNIGWTKEINLVSWNDQEAKIDIRDWNEDHTKMRKGITLSVEEVKKLAELVQKNL